MQVQNYYNGEFLPAIERHTFSNRKPATGQILAEIPRSGTPDVIAAVQAAKQAFPSWSKTSPKERARYLNLIADEIEKNKDCLVRLESDDTGKPSKLAQQIDIPRAIDNFRFFAGAILHDATDCHEMPDGVNFTLRRPVGVCALVTPWNLPLYLLTWKVAPALAMGNTVVCKPSEVTPMTAHALCKIVCTIGLPKGVFNMVHGYGKDLVYI